jgi:hypothetical protein
MKNYYEINGDIVKIRIDHRNGSTLWTIIDLADLSIIENMNRKFSAFWDKHAKSFYVYNRSIGMLHQVLMGFPGCQVDHINHDTLDNRRSANLRLATASQNQGNRKLQVGCASQYKGVCWHKNHNKWMSRITINKKVIYLGYFQDEIEAAKAYDEAAKIYFGEFALMNFPEGRK